MTNKVEFMAEYQCLLLSLAQNVATLSTSEGAEFDRLARRAAVMAHDPAQRLLRMADKER